MCTVPYDALQRLALALDALRATAKASSQQDHLLTCIDALRELEQTLETVQHATQLETPPQRGVSRLDRFSI